MISKQLIKLADYLIDKPNTYAFLTFDDGNFISNEYYNYNIELLQN